jgi:hypothetical protein
MVRKHGGRAVVGWDLWEWPKVFLEAELHVVWRDSKGNLLDVTPKHPQVQTNEILFLADPTKSYAHQSLPNVTLLLSEDPDAKRLVEVKLRIVQLMHGDSGTKSGGGKLIAFSKQGTGAHSIELLAQEQKAIVERLKRKYGSS